MDFISIFNDVMGPVMRGPSSSHTAGGYHLGRLIRSMAGGLPEIVKVAVDPQGSMAATFEPLCVDLGMVTGLLGLELTDDRFRMAMEEAKRNGLVFSWEQRPLGPGHPNTMAIHAVRCGRELRFKAAALGGGNVLISGFDGWDVSITGKESLILLECPARDIDSLVSRLELSKSVQPQKRNGRAFLCLSDVDLPDRDSLLVLSGAGNIRRAEPVFYPQRGEPLFRSGAELIKTGMLSLGKAGLSYECGILGMDEAEVLGEMERRYRIMEASVTLGLSGKDVSMEMLDLSAGGIFAKLEEGILPAGGLHSRAAARAMAALHTSNSLGVICAAPTGGSAGVIPGVLMSLAEEKKIPRDRIIRALFAASAVGLIIAMRGTFAAEEAGCQVEIGSAGAMAAAAVVDAWGGSTADALDAAAISLQNSMGSVCDPVQGRCEIPCHTRNAAAAASALVCADLILGGYQNPIPLDETIDAMMAVGRAMSPDLKCTARGGLAATPAALKAKRGSSGFR